MEDEEGIYTIPTTSEVAYVKVPLCHTPLYTIDRSTNTLVVRGKTEVSQPEVSLLDLKGNKIEISLQLSDVPNGETQYAFSAVVPKISEGYELVLKNNKCIRRMNIHPEIEAPQMQIIDARYMLALNAESGEICIRGISNPTNTDTKYIQAMLFYPGQQSSSIAGIMPAWIDQQNVSDCGEYEFSFVTPMAVGDYRMVLMRDDEETIITFSLKEGAELSLIQEGVYLESLSEIVIDKPIAVELRISKELQSNDLVLILGCYTNGLLTSCSYKTLSELTKVSDTVYRLTADAASLKAGNNVKVLLWENMKSITPVVTGKNFK